MGNNFARDILKGLTAKHKYILPKYIYDDNGSRIFQEIMQMPEYYVTQCELEILTEQAADILDALNFSGSFNLVEPGAGDGMKTMSLLKHFLEKRVDFKYMPIDISEGAVDTLKRSLVAEIPELPIVPKVGDYYEVLKGINLNTQVPALLLFLGSNLGNYSKKEALALLRLFKRSMKPGDKLLLGIDLKKNPIVINEAYFDKHGITKRFNMNLLERINRELEAEFDLDTFDFYCHYDPETGEVNSYLFSLIEQTINLGALEHTVHFKANEVVWTELSKKYDLLELESLVIKAGFKLETCFFDSKKYFTDALLTRV
ncbi:L-histidine N(alpha)-methyltransferase [Mangrovimonas aestuarii]|uniref:L-histidine N(alpha)-methyltransferase n=1 Tax=Mangrovimonas aestuarii TaxID=3018443 RepID=UPI002379B4F9|nr:L-histidine N(alpha)-methyltransferase [Mangrovimonas aestuarii]